MAEHRVIDDRGKSEALRVNRAAGLHVHKMQRQPVVVGRRRATWRERKNLEAGRVPVGSAVEMDADEDGVARLVGDVGANLERDEGIVLTRQDHLEALGLEERTKLARDVEGELFLGPERTASALIETAVPGSSTTVFTWPLG